MNIKLQGDLSRKAAVVGNRQELGVGLTRLPVALGNNRRAVLHLLGLTKPKSPAAVYPGNGEGVLRFVHRCGCSGNTQRTSLNLVVGIVDTACKLCKGASHKHHTAQQKRHAAKIQRFFRCSHCCNLLSFYGTADDEEDDNC